MNWKYILGGVVLAVIIAFAYWTISPFFITVMLDEALPGQGETPVQEPSGETPSEPLVSTGAEVVGTTGHPASGTARIVESGGKTYLRYENFKTLNGPDLFVYLATDTSASDFINLGELRATEGNINYEIPPNTDLSKYKYALVWCRAFGVLFNFANLNAI